MININDYLIQWFCKETGLKFETISDKVEENFFELGWVDSLLFINFICDVEQNFNIEFNNEDFQDRAFSTINGLSEIVERKIRNEV